MVTEAIPRNRAQRRMRADGERTRSAILRTAASLATVDGLDGLSIGNLAAATGISKSGLYAHFGSKQELQLATVEEAERILDAEVIQPALGASPGLAQLVAVCEAFLDYLQRRVFPGGCFFAATALEMGTRPGPVKERIGAFQNEFVAMLRDIAATAVEQRELPVSEDPDRLAFELHAMLLAADARFVLHDDPAVLDLARQVVRQRLGLVDGPTRTESGRSPAFSDPATGQSAPSTSRGTSSTTETAVVEKPEEEDEHAGHGHHHGHAH